MNKFEYNAVDAELKKITSLKDDMVQKLEQANTLISSAIGKEGSVWRGTSANEFEESWNRFSSKFNEFKQMIEIQEQNIRTAIEQTSAMDENGSVQTLS